jgi:hypothetical protein
LGIGGFLNYKTMLLSRRVKSKSVWLIVTMCVAVTLAVNMWRVQRAKWAMKERIHDVHALTKAYFEHGGAESNIVVLINGLRSDGIELRNPRPLDPSKPCYRVGYDRSKIPISIIEETDNVDDRRLRVRSLADGTVVLEAR